MSITLLLIIVNTWILTPYLTGNFIFLLMNVKNEILITLYNN